MNNFCTRFVKYRNDFLPICEWMKLPINRNVDTTFLQSNRCQDVAILTVLYSSLVIVKFSAHIFFINTRRPLTSSPFFKIVNEFCSSAFKRSFFCVRPLPAFWIHFIHFFQTILTGWVLHAPWNFDDAVTPWRYLPISRKNQESNSFLAAYYLSIYLLWFYLLHNRPSSLFYLNLATFKG